MSNSLWPYELLPCPTVSPRASLTHVHWISDAIQPSLPLLPLLLLPSIFLSIRVFSNELALHIRWQKYWVSSISPPVSTEGWFPLGCTGWISLQSLPKLQSPDTKQGPVGLLGTKPFCVPHFSDNRESHQSASMTFPKFQRTDPNGY